MNWSDRQNAVLNVWDNTDKNILIGAVAGSGKTTLLMEILRRCEYTTLFLAYNKTIQTEIQAKIDKAGLEQGKALTLHSLGLLAIKAAYKSVTISKNKNWDIVKTMKTRFKTIYNKHIKYNESFKVDYLLCNMNDISRTFLTDDVDMIFNHFVEVGTPVKRYKNIEVVWKLFIQIRDEINSCQNKLVVDFTDMIYLPVSLNLHIPVYCTYLLLDEAQDFNNTQHKLIEQFMAQGQIERFVAVGDKNQCIYGFTGSNPKSFELFLEYENTVELPLDICYRCPTKVVDIANKVFNNMLPAKDYEGIVATIAKDSVAESIKPGSLIICRNTAPMFKIYFALLKVGKNCFIDGIDILFGLEKFLKPVLNYNIGYAITELSYTYEDMPEETDQDRISKFYYKENLENFTEFASHLGNPANKVSSLIEKIKEIFQQPEENNIRICTIHKSKGLEEDVVYILNENLIPSKFAKTEDQLKQEYNLKYVARTRAKEELYFIEI